MGKRASVWEMMEWHILMHSSIGNCESVWYDDREGYEVRRPLYEKYADVVIDCEGRTIREIVHEIADELRGENE